MQKIFQLVSRLYPQESIPEIVPFNRFVRFLGDTSITATRDYWRSQLGGGLPLGFPAQFDTAYKAKPVKKAINNLKLSEISGFVTTATLIRGAWASAISQQLQSEDVIFRTLLSGRTAPIPGILDMIAPTLTTVPVRIKINRQSSIHDYLAAIQQQAIDMIPFEHSGLKAIRQLTTDVCGTDLQALI